MHHEGNTLGLSRSFPHVLVFDMLQVLFSLGVEHGS